MHDAEPVQFLHAPVDMSAFVAAGCATRSRVGRSTRSIAPRPSPSSNIAVSTHVIDRHGPEEAARRLDRLMVGVQGAIDHRGICFQSADLAVDGGKFYLSAGAPRSSGHDEEQMLLALTEIVALDVGLALRAGANSGSVFMGEIRSTHRSTFITMGDPVNLAARVMAKATPGSVFSTRPVLDRSRTLFEHVAVPPFMVKGKAKPVEAFAVGSRTRRAHGDRRREPAARRSRRRDRAVPRRPRVGRVRDGLAGAGGRRRRRRQEPTARRVRRHVGSP